MKTTPEEKDKVFRFMEAVDNFFYATDDVIAGIMQKLYLTTELKPCEIQLLTQFIAVYRRIAQATNQLSEEFYRTCQAVGVTDVSVAAISFPETLTRLKEVEIVMAALSHSKPLSDEDLRILFMNELRLPSQLFPQIFKYEEFIPTLEILTVGRIETSTGCYDAIVRLQGVPFHGQFGMNMGYSASIGCRTGQGGPRLSHSRFALHINEDTGQIVPIKLA